MEYISFDKSRPLDIIPLGRVAIDFNPVDYFKTLAESTTFKKYVGGSPANIAVGMARLGKKCGFLAKVSNDRFGDYVIDFFKNEGIDTSHITRCENGESLGLTFTEILTPDTSSILMYRNGIADLALDVDDIDQSYISSAKCLLVSGTSLCVSPSREAAMKAAMLAKKTGTPLVFDIDYRSYNWKNKDEISIYYAALAEKADIILGSREEFDLTEALIEKGRDDIATKNYYLWKNAKIVIIKHGKQGSTAYTKDGDYTVRPFPITALKSFGGGDGYASAFLSGLLDGNDIKDALEMGSASASMLVASHACSLDMPKETAIREYIDKCKTANGDIYVTKNQETKICL